MMFIRGDSIGGVRRLLDALELGVLEHRDDDLIWRSCSVIDMNDSLDRYRVVGEASSIKVKSCDGCPFHSYDDDGCNAMCKHPDLNRRGTPFEFDWVNNRNAVKDRLPPDCPLLKNAVVISWDRG
jgi:hypothetical protein